MRLTKKYLILFSVCGFISVVTTIVIHSGFFDFNLIFAEQVQLYKNSIYNLGKYWVIIHCLLVLFSMWGIFLIKFRKNLPLTGLGILFYCVFSFTEIYRQLLYLFYLNGQYLRFELADSAELRGRIMHDIKSFDYTSYALFALFIMAFAFGNLCYGIGLFKGNKWDRILAIVLLVWSLHGFIILGNVFWKLAWIDVMNENFSLIYQPAARFVIGYWFITKINENIETQLLIRAP